MLTMSKYISQRQGWLCKRVAGKIGPIAPMRLKKIDDPQDLLGDYNKDDLIVQQKYDGWKIQAIKDSAGAVKVYSRRGEDFTPNVDPLIKDLEDKMDNGDFWLGELVWLKDGKQDISSVQTIAGSNPEGAKEKLGESGELIFYVYDLLWSAGKNLTNEGYLDRYNKLKSKIGSGTGHIKLVPNYSWDRLEQATKDALKAGGEGIVIKPKNSKYVYASKGSTEKRGEWVKFKPGAKAKEEDVTVKGYERGKDKLIFPAYQKVDGKMVEVGRVSGLPKEDEKWVKLQIDSGKSVVIEVSYQEKTDRGKLRHIGFVRVRKDKSPKQAGIRLSKRAIDTFASIESDLIEGYPDLEDYIKEAAGRIEKKYLRWFVRELQKNPGDYTATKLYDYISEFKRFENRLPIKDIYQYSLELLQQEISKIKGMVAELEPQAKRLAEEYFALLSEKRQQYGHDNRRQAYEEARQWLNQIDPPELQQMVRKQISNKIKERETEGQEQGNQSPKQTAFKNSDVIYNDSRFLVVLPGTPQASQYFGQGTQWCTSAKNNNQFVNYSSRGIYLYYIIDKENQGDELSKIAWVMTKGDGSPRVAQIFNTSDHGITESKVQDYLGDEFSLIISAINNDISKRSDTKWKKIMATMGPEEFKQNLDAIDDNKKLEVAIKILEANNNPETRKAGVDYIMPTVKKLIEQGDPSFFSYKLHKMPEFQDLARIAAERLVEQDNEAFIYYDLHKMPEFQDLARIAAEKFADRGMPGFLHYNLHEIPEFKDLTRIMAENLAEQDSNDFFRYNLHEIPEFKDLTRIAAKNLVERGDEDFFRYNLHEIPEFKDLTRIAAKNLAEQGKPDFFRYSLHEIPEFQDLIRIAAEKLAERGNPDFFRYNIHEIPELQDLTRIAAEKVVEQNSNNFFYHKLHEIPELQDLAYIAAKELAEPGDSNFFRYNLHKIPKYKEIWNKYNPNNKIANLSLSKRAGKIDYPQKMYQDILGWVLKEAKNLKRGLFRKAKDSVEKTFTIDISDTSQYKRESWFPVMFDEAQALDWDKRLTVVLFDKPVYKLDPKYRARAEEIFGEISERDNDYGWWGVRDGDHEIWMFEVLEQIKSGEIKYTLQHELTHMMQEIMNTIITMYNERRFQHAGLPGKYRKEDEGLPHNLEDDEFFSTVNEFIGIISDYLDDEKISGDLARDVVRGLLESNEILAIMRDKDPKKFQKLVREVYRALEPRFQKIAISKRATEMDTGQFDAWMQIKRRVEKLRQRLDDPKPERGIEKRREQYWKDQLDPRSLLKPEQETYNFWEYPREQKRPTELSSRELEKRRRQYWKDQLDPKSLLKPETETYHFWEYPLRRDALNPYTVAKNFPIRFFETGMHERAPEKLVKLAATSLAEQYPKKFFELSIDHMRIDGIGEISAQAIFGILNSDPQYFVQQRVYNELGGDIVLQKLTRDPTKYFSLGLQHDQDLIDYTASAARIIPSAEKYVELGLHKIGELLPITAGFMRDIYSKSANNFFRMGLHKDIGIDTDITKDAARALIDQAPTKYITYGLQNYKELLEQTHELVLKRPITAVLHKGELPEEITKDMEFFKELTLEAQQEVDRESSPERPKEAKDYAKKLFDSGYTWFVHTGSAKNLGVVDQVYGEVCASVVGKTKELFMKRRRGLGPRPYDMKVDNKFEENRIKENIAQMQDGEPQIAALFYGKASHAFKHDVSSQRGEYGLKRLTKEIEGSGFDEAWFNPAQKGNRLVGYIVVGNPRMGGIQGVM
jgi:hypothetical protein